MMAQPMVDDLAYATMEANRNVIEAARSYRQMADAPWPVETAFSTRPPVIANHPRQIGSCLYGADEEIADYVASKIAYMSDGRGFGQRDLLTGQLPYAAIGVVRGGKIVGGSVFYNYKVQNGRPIDIEVSGAFEPSMWCIPSTLRALFHYPFVQIGCARMTTITGRKNKSARAMDLKLGFKLEGVARRAIFGTEDAIIYGMLREECRWVKGAAS